MRSRMSMVRSGSESKFPRSGVGKSRVMVGAPLDRSVLLWHVHGSWTDAFVRGRHRYLLPVTPQRDRNGLGRLDRPWPSTLDVPCGTLRDTDVDLVVLQRPEELQLAEDWLGRRPGAEVPA